MIDVPFLWPHSPFMLLCLMIFQVHGILRGSRISPLQRSVSSVFTCGNCNRKKYVGKRSFSLYIYIYISYVYMYIYIYILHYFFFIWGSDSNISNISAWMIFGDAIQKSQIRCPVLVSGKLAEQAKWKTMSGYNVISSVIYL